MATDTAGKWIIGIVLYFLCLFSILTFIGNLSSEYDLSDTSVTYSGGSAGLSLDNLGGCDNPRQEVSKYSDSCKDLIDVGSVYDNATCSSFEGCSWTETSALFQFFGSANVTCSGNINLTYYNNNQSFEIYGITGIASQSICDLSNLSTNSQLCEQFGCTWYSSGSQDLLTYSGVSGIWTIIKDIVGLNINFGASSTTLNTLLNFIFIVLPLLLLILAGLIFIRG